MWTVSRGYWCRCPILHFNVVLTVSRRTTVFSNAFLDSFALEVGWVSAAFGFVVLSREKSIEENGEE